jgi:Transcriptional regulator containing GAF, AAA-type ATPase, and DNA binding domains
MNLRHPRAAVWGIWGLVAAFAVLQVAAWTIMGEIPRRPAALVQVVAAWVVMLVLATISTRRIGGLSRTLTQHEHLHTETLDHVAQLQLSNAMLEIIARSVDVTLAFQALAQRIARLVPCDRVGLALLSENGQEFQTYTARVHGEERRNRPRPDIVFKIDRTALGTVVRSREPLLIADTSEGAADFLDINVLHTAGLGSALMVPLVAKGRGVGTLNVVSRHLAAFNQQHIDVLLPIAEIFAVAHVAQQLQMAVGKYRSMEVMSDLTLSIAAEINSALQTIIGHCGLLDRGHPEPELRSDLATIVHQARRISGLLEKMRSAANERLKEVAEEVSQGGIPSSPEAYGEREVT